MGFGAVILAAGAASRMGSAKQILRFRGESLIRRAAFAVLDAGCAPAVVVLGAHAELTRCELDGLPVIAVVNDEWETGLASSLRAGIEALIATDPAAEGTVVALCDQPFVTAGVISRLMASCQASGRRLAASSYGGTVGVPALFRRSLFGDLIQLQGSSGARQVISRHAAEADVLDFAAGEADIDTPNDFLHLIDGELEQELNARGRRARS